MFAAAMKPKKENKNSSVVYSAVQRAARSNSFEKQGQGFVEHRPNIRRVHEKGKNTGLPNNLREGIENLSGYSMDDVNVHYNSPRPEQLYAHAYTQGADIHIAPGQDKHLPHEAWHVVQQKQGRVSPTMQMKGGMNINDDMRLENEATRMGNNAMQMKAQAGKNNENKSKAVAEGVAQQKSSVKQENCFVDNRPEVITQRKLQKMAYNSPQVRNDVIQRNGKGSGAEADTEDSVIPGAASNQSLAGGFLTIYQVAAQNEDQLRDTSLGYIKITLMALQIIDENAAEIAAAENPRSRAMELTNIGIEDGFNAGESAEHIRANAKMIVTNFPDNTAQQISYINQTLRRGDPCLTARMDMIQNHIAEVVVGEIEVEGTPDNELAMKIYVLWSGVEDPNMTWSDFVQTLPHEITSHNAFLASLRHAKEAASVY